MKIDVDWEEIDKMLEEAEKYAEEGLVDIVSDILGKVETAYENLTADLRENRNNKANSV